MAGVPETHVLLNLNEAIRFGVSPILIRHEHDLLLTTNPSNTDGPFHTPMQFAINFSLYTKTF